MDISDVVTVLTETGKLLIHTSLDSITTNGAGVTQHELSSQV